MSRRPSTDPSDTWTSHERVRTGEEICIRPLRADDREREIAFINSLSERTVYFRLFTPMKLLPPHVLEQLMVIDYDDRMVFVATVQMRVPAHDGQDSEPMADTIPAAWRTVFRPDRGHFGGRSGTLSAMISERCPRSPARDR